MNLIELALKKNRISLKKILQIFIFFIKDNEVEGRNTYLNKTTAIKMTNLKYCCSYLFN